MNIKFHLVTLYAMKPRISKTKIYVAMSGGVDSSVAAALLKKEGHHVTGVFMKPWQPYDEREVCLWKQDREDAMRVASQLNIPFKTWDFSREYKREVTDYMIREYKAGRTPNPDVMCNKEIKFGLFLKKALREGAEYIATGHYVRLKKQGTEYHLLKGKDLNKDQSYFLWTLDQRILKHCLFPIGGYTKPEVRKLAKKFGLSVYDKKDSQGVCFIGPLNMKEFLTRYIKPNKGKILDQAGKVIGVHDGIYYYTIGQRHGLNIGDGQGPYYVTGKDVKKNIIFVGPNSDTRQKEARVANIHWVNGEISLPGNIDIKVRYRTKSVRATLKKNGDLVFKRPERAVTAGQSAVFYSGSHLLGGGVIV